MDDDRNSDDHDISNAIVGSHFTACGQGRDEIENNKHISSQTVWMEFQQRDSVQLSNRQRCKGEEEGRGMRGQHDNYSDYSL